MVTFRARWIAGIVSASTAILCTALSEAAQVSVPNASFESPTTSYASPLVDSWQKTPKPDWYVESGGFLWSQLVGAFRNPAPGSPDRIDNCDGEQALWIFAVPEVTFFQDYDSVDWNDPSPTHAFDARFETGNAYRLTIGAIGGGGGMLDGVTLELSLYCRDDSSNRITVATTSITNSRALFPNNTHLVDFQLAVPQVKATDAWAGRHLGVRVTSTVSTNLQGGYWDLDNVRLEAIPAPTLAARLEGGDAITLTFQSEPELRFEILATTNLALPLASWTSVGTVTNTTGTATFTNTMAGLGQQFYWARQVP